MRIYERPTLQVGAKTDVWDLNGYSTPLHAAASAQTNAAKMVRHELFISSGRSSLCDDALLGHLRCS